MSPLTFVEVITLAVLGLAALALGGLMAWRPNQRRYEILRPVTWAMVFGMLSVTFTGLTNMCIGLSYRAKSWTPDVTQAIFSGIAEMMLPSLVCFVVLTVAWGLAAVGLRRLT